MIAERQWRGQAKRRAVAVPGSFRAVLETAVPVDRACSGRQAQRQRRIGRFLHDDLHRCQTERRRHLFLGEPIGGVLRIGWQPEGGDQCRQRFLARFVLHAERIDMSRMYPDEIGNPA